MADAANAPAQAFPALRPGGVFVAAELDSFPRFLSDTAGAALEAHWPTAFPAATT